MLKTLQQNKPILLIWSGLLIYAAWAHLNFGAFDAIIALKGFSIVDFTNSILYPDNFTRDYPGGSWISGSSLIPWAYPALESIGIHSHITLAVLMTFEVATLALGAYLLLISIDRHALPVSLILVTCLLAYSHIRYSNLARFGNPFFHGQFYGFADGFRLLAIAFYLQNRHRLSSSFLIIGFMIHPIKTLFGFAFIAGMHLYRWRSIFMSDKSLPYLIFCLFAVVWAYFWVGFGQAPAGDMMTPQEFFKYAPLYNSHWFPQDLGIFTEYHTQYATAFLASLLVTTVSLLRCDIDRDVRNQISLGIISLALISILGLVIAWLEIYPAIIKICLQRATVLLLSVATIITLVTLIQDLSRKNWWNSLLLAGLILTAFFDLQTWPVLLAIIYAITYIVTREQYSNHGTTTVLVSSFTAALTAYELFLYLGSMTDPDYITTQLSILAVITVTYYALRMLDKRIVFISPEGDNRLAVTLVLISIFIPSAMYWSIENRTLSDKYIQQGHAFKEVQLWARDNTATDALFMTDPTMRYGWRDYSRRSSFGTLKEWYKTGWLYTGNRKALQDGIERGNRLGMESLVDESDGLTRNEFISRSYETALRNFYHPDATLLEELTRDYEIDYVVMDKRKASNNGALPTWDIAYSNRHYAVLIPPHIEQSR